ncbi:MAG: helix-turn-helix transcriptional regulator, partial [Mycobacterium sp.]
GEVPTIEIRHRMRIAREYAGLEQEQLAERMGVSRTTVGNAETGRVKPRKIVVNAWAMACGVPVSWILTGQSGGANPDGPGFGLGIISTEDAAKIQVAGLVAMPRRGTLPHGLDDRVAS